MIGLKCTQFLPNQLFYRGLAIIVDNFPICPRSGQTVWPEVLIHINLLLNTGYRVLFYCHIPSFQLNAMREHLMSMPYEISQMIVILMFSESLTVRGNL